ALPAKGGGCPLWKPPKPTPASAETPSLHAPRRRERALRSQPHARCPAASPLLRYLWTAAASLVRSLPLSAQRSAERSGAKRLHLLRRRDGCTAAGGVLYSRPETMTERAPRAAFQRAAGRCEAVGSRERIPSRVIARTGARAV